MGSLSVAATHPEVDSRPRPNDRAVLRLRELTQAETIRPEDDMPDPSSLIQALANRVARLEAAAEIARVHQKYIRDLAARDWDAVAGAYTEDAICDIRHHGVHVGRQSIRAMFGAELEDIVLAKDGYILSSPDITVAEDSLTAHGVWTWHRLQADFRTSWGLMRVWGPWSEGTYITDYRREEGKWKISKLWFRVHAPDHDEEFVAAGQAGRVLGGAGRN